MSRLDIAFVNTCHAHMGWLQRVGSLKLQVFFAEYRVFYRALLQKRPMILRRLIIVATLYNTCVHTYNTCVHTYNTCVHTCEPITMSLCMGVGSVVSSYVCMGVLHGCMYVLYLRDIRRETR